MFSFLVNAPIKAFWGVEPKQTPREFPMRVVRFFSTYTLGTSHQSLRCVFRVFNYLVDALGSFWGVETPRILKDSSLYTSGTPRMS